MNSDTKFNAVDTTIDKALVETSKMIVLKEQVKALIVNQIKNNNKKLNALENDAPESVKALKELNNDSINILAEDYIENIVIKLQSKYLELQNIIVTLEQDKKIDLITKIEQINNLLIELKSNYKKVESKNKYERDNYNESILNSIVLDASTLNTVEELEQKYEKQLESLFDLDSELKKLFIENIKQQKQQSEEMLQQISDVNNESINKLKTSQQSLVDMAVDLENKPFKQLNSLLLSFRSGYSRLNRTLNVFFLSHMKDIQQKVENLIKKQGNDTSAEWNNLKSQLETLSKETKKLNDWKTIKPQEQQFIERYNSLEQQVKQYNIEKTKKEILDGYSKPNSTMNVEMPEEEIQKLKVSGEDKAEIEKSMNLIAEAKAIKEEIQNKVQSGEMTYEEAKTKNAEITKKLAEARNIISNLLVEKIKNAKSLFLDLNLYTALAQDKIWAKPEWNDINEQNYKIQNFINQAQILINDPNSVLYSSKNNQDSMIKKIENITTQIDRIKESIVNADNAQAQDRGKTIKVEQSITRNASIIYAIWMEKRITKYPSLAGHEELEQLKVKVEEQFNEFKKLSKGWNSHAQRKSSAKLAKLYDEFYNKTVEAGIPIESKFQTPRYVVSYMAIRERQFEVLKNTWN
ncbi:hypothetical protein [[Mycoplasma] gypis]|uniref:Uncharacterized protein n=1 Tax=[Mycoplasma] gypis TaxID=92404 RepID=A0ABZ2RN63_9BACT|nr:hypothetical protein [[Mycoplasma] gypis]MBN0919573.1 hypothetical protein [[Mycoplasma] gypis]